MQALNVLGGSAMDEFAVLANQTLGNLSLPLTLASSHIAAIP
jgi:hypothetical protein